MSGQVTPEMSSTSISNGLDDAIFERLLRERVVFLGSEVTDEAANRISAQLLLLESEEPKEDIKFYINSPGGSVTAGMAVYDTMRHVKPDIATFAIGFAASMGQFLLSSGAQGKRYALPNSQILMHQPHGGVAGTESDVVIRAAAVANMKQRIAEITADQTGQPVETIIEDGDRDRWFTALEAKEYGFVDHVLEHIPEGRDREAADVTT